MTESTTKETKVKYNDELLRKCIEMDKATLIGNYIKLTRNSIINGSCNCGTEFSNKFHNIVNNGGAYCKKCVMTNRYEKMKASNLKNHGVENPAQSKIIQEKTKNTNRKRHGVDYPGQSAAVKEKAKVTNLKNLGVENPFQSEAIKAKSRFTNKEKCGFEYPAQSEKVKNKIKETNIERHGISNGHSQEVQEKIKKTNKIKYGKEWYPQTNEWFESTKIANRNK